MRTWKHFPRLLLILTLLIAICAGMFAPRMEAVEAKPQEAVDELNVFISEFRFLGPGGANDEFIEIYNATGASITTNNWKLRKSSGCGSSLENLVTNINITLAPGQYYLFARSGFYTGSTPSDILFTNEIADNGGIALTDSSNNPIDQVGLCSDTGFLEGTALTPLSGTADQSYERKTAGSAGSCKDTDNNAADFSVSNPSNPKNSTYTPYLPCLGIINVTSVNNGVHSAGDTIDIDVTFSNNVDVTGNPLLLLETGVTDQNAVYVAGSDGDATITFRYTVTDTDSSIDLDYVSATALSLNGGSITGAIGDAVLVLPKPGTNGSLGFNNNIQIDAVGNPSLVNIKRQNPLSTTTNSDTLVFRATFSEAVQNVDFSDFVVTGTTGTITPVSPVTGNVFDLTVSGGDLLGLNGTVGIDISGAASINDVMGNPMPVTPEPSIDETYLVDNTLPTVKVEQSSSDPATGQPVLFEVKFSEKIDTSTFTIADIDKAGSTAPGINWSIINSGDDEKFTLSASTSGNGVIIASIPAGGITDLAGNTNTASTSIDNSITLNDLVPPTVTIEQASGQTDPDQTLPINFLVTFSEVINTATFTTADITQTGTATGVTWSITDSGDHKTFTLSATTASGYGTIVPVINANRVTDLSGNNNTPSTSTDNSVNYVFVPTNTPLPTNTITPSPTGTTLRRIVINEVAWAGTGSSTLSSDEWIELYNPGSTAINLAGWTLKDSSTTINLSGTIPAGGYFLLERDDNNTVSDIAADLIYTTMELNNSGEILTLYDPSGKSIDTANGNGGSWPAGSASTFGTMERANITGESDSAWATNTGLKKNGKAANGTDILGTPKASNTPFPTATPTRVPTNTATPIPPTAKIDPRPIINEILARPGFDWNQDGRADVFDEFIEIKNLSPIDISLNGWRLDKVGSTSFNLPNITLKPGQHIVFYSAESKLLLSDGGETVRLFNPNGKIFDAYTYTIARAEDKSICRLPDGNVFNGWFEDCTPTPGLTNTREGQVPSAPDGSTSPVCELPDTIPSDFFYAECRGYGTNIWNPYYWDQLFELDRIWIDQNTSKWKSFFE